jgi:hypothetical protein
MFEPIEGGSVVEVQGLKCNLPPEGYVFNMLTKKLEHRGVHSRSDIPEEQYWERIPIPTWYQGVIKSWDEYDKKKKDDDEDFYDDRLETYKQQEWDRRLNGFWFKNFNPKTGQSESVYLTGFHYLYLQWWPIDIGYPKFRFPDLEKAYFMQYCIEDPLCMGGVEVTKRRFGKSFWAGLFVTEYITRTKMTNGGIQSKTGTDAKKFFSKTVVNPFRRLPKFFRPEYDMSLGVNPKTEMRFQKTNVRGKKAEENIGKDELGSIIDFQASDKVAYDGQKLHRYVCDETGKTTEVDVYERHEVVRYCLLDDEGNIIGKSWYTTTVEKIDSDKDGVQDAFKLLWAESDQYNKGENNRTKTGLYRFFMSAKRTRYFDPYGNPDEERTLQAIMLDRESVKNNPRSLNARIRKEPLTVEEAFMDDGDKCIFNITNIMERERVLVEEPIPKRSVLFYRDPETQLVGWRDIRKGEEDFCWQISKLLPHEQANKFRFEGGVRTPARTDVGAMSVDSYSNSQGGRKYGSKASAWIGLKMAASNPEDGLKAIGHLYGRPNEKDELHLQVMLAAEYYGFQVWFEHNSDSYDAFFRDRGRRGYLGLYPLSCIEPTKRESTERHRGVPTTPFSLTRQHDLGIWYFENHCHRIDFPELFPPAKKFDPYKRTEYDSVVSFLILIVVLTEPVVKPPPKKFPLVQVFK